MRRINPYKLQKLQSTCRIQKFKLLGASSYQVRRINPVSFRNIHHLWNSKLKLKGASSYQAERIRNCKVSKNRSQSLAYHDQRPFRFPQLISQHLKSSNHVLESFKSSGDRIKRIIAFNLGIVPIHMTSIQNSIYYSISCLI